jgi:AAA15 family ATPase/GTPase
MIKKVHIKNFKTLKDLAFPCTRMNLFIGDTSTGKSNVLEALTLISRGASTNSKFDQRLIRYDDIEDLFPLRDLSEPMVIDIGAIQATMHFEHGQFKLQVQERTAASGKLSEGVTAQINTQGIISGNFFQYTTHLRRYAYDPEVKFGHNMMKELEAPFGANLPGLLAANKQLRSRISKVLEGTGLRLEVNLKENALRLSKLSDENVVVTLPYRNLSDTIKRYLFMYSILETVKGSTLLFDEPEQNTFPFYTKHMAEMMALDKGNQYLITTHNEYLFRSVVEKTATKDLSVFISYLDADGFTQLKRLSTKELGVLLDGDIFFNLDRYTPE